MSIDNKICRTYTYLKRDRPIRQSIELWYLEKNKDGIYIL